jgi:hypothetical protein
MVMADTNPPYILGVSNSFDVLQNSASLTTDEFQYYEGELIDVTFTMNQTVDTLEPRFAWIGLFRQDVQNYSLPSTGLSILLSVDRQSHAFLQPELALLTQSSKPSWSLLIPPLRTS